MACLGIGQLLHKPKLSLPHRLKFATIHFMALIAKHNDSSFGIGDTVRVLSKIQEGEKTRTQIFQGTVIAIRGEGDNKMFTVRRLGSGGIGIERIFPLSSPLIERVEVAAKGHVRRAKLYYLRQKPPSEVAALTRRKVKKQKAPTKKIIRRKKKKK